MCPSSNLMTSKCGAMQLLPHWKKLAEAGVPMAISCDDTLLIQSNIQTEVFELATAFRLNGEWLKENLLNSLSGVFCEPDTREDLKRKVEAFRV